jgi:hypothetical protein
MSNENDNYIKLLHYSQIKITTNTSEVEIHFPKNHKGYDLFLIQYSIVDNTKKGELDFTSKLSLFDSYKVKNYQYIKFSLNDLLHSNSYLSISYVQADVKKEIKFGFYLTDLLIKGAEKK